MADTIKLGILSDIHYAGPQERALGSDYELRAIRNRLLRAFVRLHRRFVWLHDPLAQNHLLDKFIEESGPLDYAIANGDFACDCASVGVSNDASCESAKECVDKLRHKFGASFLAILGDHDLGKLSFFGGNGGMRLASWHRAQSELGLRPFWRVAAGNYVLIGFTSSLVALPVFEPDIVPAERADWESLRAGHLAEIRQAFSSLQSNQRVLLFCHDPTALPYLWHDEAIRARLDQVEHTIIGHLHSNLILWKSRRLAGMPRIDFLGHSPKRFTSALREARHWRPFKVRLCPALAGIELLKDGGYLTVELDAAARVLAGFRFHPLPR